MDTYQLLKDIVADNAYKLIDEDEDRLVIRYQLSNVNLCPNKEDENFVVMLVSGLEDVNEENLANVLRKCNKLNAELKEVKFYLLDDCVAVSCEFYYMERKDLEFQIKKGLVNIAAAKGRYKMMYVG